MDTSRRGRPAGFLMTVLVLGTAMIGASPLHASTWTGVGVGAENARRALAQHSLRMLDGRDVTVGALRGEVVVLNFWASWCGPCRKELPALSALNAEIAPKGARVIAVSIDQDLENVRRFARVHRLALPIAHDGPEGLARALDLQAVPFTIVLDRSGAVAFTTRGTDARAIAELGNVTRQLVDRTPYVTHTQGETP